eukprot:12414889-Karenia_brevis.AAC.1
MVEGVARAKGLLSLAKEVGFKELSHVIKLGTECSAAKSFVRKGGFVEHETFGDKRFMASEGASRGEVSSVQGPRGGEPSRSHDQ